ncbi:OsmC family protein [Streptomyces sp. NBC_01231]|nr:OsmC family protein [Streptomyces sp. NBC_01231]
MTEDSLRSVTVERISTGHFVATNARGAAITFGTSSSAHGDTAFTPVELLLAAIGGCSAADVDVATSRHAEPTRFSVAVTGDKVSDELGNRMTDLTVTFSVTFPDGDGDGKGEGADRARAILPRAVRTSHDRLCTVSRTVELGTPVTATIEEG